jgi:uncharacterized membrane protein
MSDRALRTTIASLAVVGLAVAGYLVYVHYAGVAPICSIAHGCEIVQSSSYAKLGGIPVAVLGLLGYAAILLASLVRAEAARAAAAGIAVTGAAFSGWLTYVEVARIHAICPWCVLSAGVMVLLAVFTTVRYAAPISSGSTPRRAA